MRFRYGRTSGGFTGRNAASGRRENLLRKSSAIRSNRIAHSIDRSEIDWVHVWYEEAGAFAAAAERLLTGRLTACAGSCGPGSLHFINGLYEANRNRAPVILIATQIVRQDLGFE